MIMVYSKHSIVVHQHPCKHFSGLMAFLIEFLNSLSENYLKHFESTTKTKLFWFTSFVVVVMGKEHTISEANRQLGDTTYYKRLDPTSDHQRLLNEKLTEMLASKEISENNIEYLTVANIRAGRFYLLPKIHKPGNPGRRLSLQTVT